MDIQKILPLLEISFNVSETSALLKREGFRFLSWGCDKMIAVESTEKDKYGTMAKGLLLHVNGHHHKGFCLITLNGNDTYTFRLLNNQFNQKGETVTDIYFDELFDRIDKLIEYIPAYNR